MKERNLKLMDGKWYVDFRFKGKRIRQFGGYTKDQARNALAKLRIVRLDESLGFKRPGQGRLSRSRSSRMTTSRSMQSRTRGPGSATFSP
jgi:hypothetical protein